MLPTPGYIINECFEDLCEADLIQRTIVMHHPIEVKLMVHCPVYEYVYLSLQFNPDVARLNEPH